MNGIYRLTAEQLADAHLRAMRSNAHATLAAILREWSRRSRLRLPERALYPDLEMEGNAL